MAIDDDSPECVADGRFALVVMADAKGDLWKCLLPYGDTLTFTHKTKPEEDHAA